jgi:hypothetical protein
VGCCPSTALLCSALAIRRKRGHNRRFRWVPPTPATASTTNLNTRVSPTIPNLGECAAPTPPGGPVSPSRIFDDLKLTLPRPQPSPPSYFFSPQPQIWIRPSWRACRRRCALVRYLHGFLGCRDTEELCSGLCPGERLANSRAQGKQTSLLQNSTAPHPSPPPHRKLAHQNDRHLLELPGAWRTLQTLDSTLIGHHRGKGTPRRKVKKVQRNAGTDDKKLQAALKKLNVQPIQAIEEVNMFKSDGNVIHFSAPKGGSLPFISIRTRQLRQLRQLHVCRHGRMHEASAAAARQLIHQPSRRRPIVPPLT